MQLSNAIRFRRVLGWSFVVCAAAASAQQGQNRKLEQEFQSAVTLYHAGQLDQAAKQLEVLLPQTPRSFEVHELLGLVYAAQSQNSRAIEQLQAAVNLQPGSAAAHTNLAAALSHSGEMQAAGVHFQKALALEPRDYDANHNLGEFYVQTGKVAEATPFLQQAQQLRPSYDNGYDLALAYLLTGRLEDARQLVHGLLAMKNTGELHNLLGQIEEKDGKFVTAANEFETAARLDPSEDNLFAWGSELLLHRTYDPAIDVFETASRRYPNSPRLRIGLGMALDLRGRYDDAVKALLAAADLNPTDARCYLYLSKAYDNSPSQADEVIQRFQRYAELEPHNGIAQYYYAMSLWKGKRLEDSKLDVETIRSLLEKAVALDATLPEPHVQLGNLYSGQHEYAKSIAEYKRALELNPNLPDAHYRLGQDYVHSGEKEQAQAEFAVYQRLRAQHLAEVDKERAEVKQFVYAEKDAPPAKQ
jgi:tetratricopeptide (TPR) repeat protein